MNKSTSKLILIAALSALLAVGALLAKPAVNTSAKQHPNLAAAQKLCVQAYDKLTAAQKANEYDLAGHAARAKDLLEQANAEIKLATEESNENSGVK